MLNYGRLTISAQRLNYGLNYKAGFVRMNELRDMQRDKEVQNRGLAIGTGCCKEKVTMR